MKKTWTSTTGAAALVAMTMGCTSAPPRPGTPAAAARQADEDVLNVVKRVAQRNIRPLADGDYPPVDSLAAAKAARAPEGITWSYPWGVTLYGLIRSTDVTADAEVAKFVVEHDRIVTRYYAWLKGVNEKLGADDEAVRAFALSTRLRGLMRLGSLDSCGAMGTQLAEVMLRDKKKASREHEDVAARVAGWVIEKQDRLPDGTLWRPRSSEGPTVWIDDLYMGGVFMTRWYKLTGDRKHIDDAARQVINMAQRLQDTDGVWFHGYFENDKKHSPIKWGRANGWAMLTTAEVLSAMPDGHPERAKVLNILKRHIDGVKPLQAPSGMWRQVLDHPELWEETSATAMFTYSIARAVNRGWIDKSYMSMARRGFEGISANVTADGSVNNTCEGTNIRMDLEYYAQRNRPPNDHHGPGPVLLAGTEILAGKR
jgi:unsaturated rhamnogalacturonyl hydrolase